MLATGGSKSPDEPNSLRFSLLLTAGKGFFNSLSVPAVALWQRAQDSSTGTVALTGPQGKSLSP